MAMKGRGRSRLALVTSHETIAAIATHLEELYQSVAFRRRNGRSESDEVENRCRKGVDGNCFGFIVFTLHLN